LLAAPSSFDARLVYVCCGFLPPIPPASAIPLRPYREGGPLHRGFPVASRSVQVSVPFFTVRASSTGAPSIVMREPTISSPSVNDQRLARGREGQVNAAHAAATLRIRDLLDRSNRASHRGLGGGVVHPLPSGLRPLGRGDVHEAKYGEGKSRQRQTY
jgi:hypothetical protein